MSGMKKFFGIGLLALLTTAYLTSSCSRDEFSGSLLEAKKNAFNENFVAEYGKIAPNHDWGFGLNNGTRAAFTRTIIPSINDPFTDYSLEELNAMYKTLPESYVLGSVVAAEDYNHQNTPAILLTAGDYKLHFWTGSRDIYVQGNVTLTSTTEGGDKSINQARIYVLEGATLTLNMDSYINDLQIFVHPNATLNYTAEHLYKQGNNDGGKIFNRGTINFGDNFEANQNSIVYNENIINATNITSKPGDGNRSFVYNYGEMEVKGNFEMNSCTNFYNDGKVTVTGATVVTQKDIWWINKSHYVTGTMEFSAGNISFYNYCQLKVNGNCKFHDGAFNMMNGSYAEFGTIQVNNFHVNLYNNSGFNVLNGGKFGRNGAGINQGFFAVDGATAYVRLGGDTYIPRHKDYSFQVSGANLNLVYSTGLKFYEEVNIPGSDNDICKYNYDQITYSTETTEDLPEMHLWKLNDVTKIFTGSDFSKVTVAAAAYPSCSTTWNVPGITPPSPKRIVLKQAGRVFCEDLGNVNSSDIDYNDVVFDAWLYVERTGDDESTDVFHKAFVQLLAAGGTILIKVADVDVHAAFGFDDDVMINTYKEGPSIIGGAKHKEYGTDFSTLPDKIVITDASYVTGDDGELNIFNIPITVRTSDNKAAELTQDDSSAPLKFMAPLGTPWAAERVKFGQAYPMFSEWVANPTETPWSLPSETATYDLSDLPAVSDYAPTEEEIGAATSTPVTPTNPSGQGEEEESDPTFSSVTGTDLNIDPTTLTPNSSLTLPAASFNNVSAATVYIYGTGDGEVLVNGVSATTESSAPRFGFTRSATPVVKVCQLGPSNLKTNRVVVSGYNFRVVKCSMVNQTGNYSVSEPTGKGDIIYNTSTILDWGDNGGAVTITNDALKSVQVGSKIRVFGIGYASSYWEVQAFGFNTTGGWNTSTKLSPQDGTSFSGNGAKEIVFPITTQAQANMVKGGRIVVQGYNFILKYVTVENPSSGGDGDIPGTAVWSINSYSGQNQKIESSDLQVLDTSKAAHLVIYGRHTSNWWEIQVLHDWTKILTARSDNSYASCGHWENSNINVPSDGVIIIPLKASEVALLKQDGMRVYLGEVTVSKMELRQ